MTWTLVTPDGADRDSFDSLEAANVRVGDYLKVGWPRVGIRDDSTGQMVGEAPAVVSPIVEQPVWGGKKDKALPAAPVVTEGFDQAIARMLVAVRTAAKTSGSYPEKEVLQAIAAAVQLQAEANWICKNAGYGPTTDKTLALHRSVVAGWKNICDQLALDLAFLQKGKST